MCKKPTDPLDAPPFIIGCITLLKQFHVDNTDHFLALMGQYVRSFVDAMPGWVSNSSVLWEWGNELAPSSLYVLFFLW